jgi:DNA adenine methylase
MVVTGKKSAPIKWHGGKYYLAARIIEEMPGHTHYVETHFGGGAVLFRKPPAFTEKHSELVNDIDGELTNFWRVLQGSDSFERFKRVVEATPFSKVEWNRAKACESIDPVERAVAFFVRYRQSRQGLGRDFATMSRTRTRRGMNEQASSWWSAIDGLDDAHHRLRRVVIVNDDANELIQREDCPHTFFYCDPPYVHRTRSVDNAYRCEMTEPDHEALLSVLASVRGRFILSGYADSLYNSVAAQYGWRRVDIRIDNKASGLKTKPVKTESLWMNY